MIRKTVAFALATVLSSFAFGQNGYWQQKVKYLMDVDMNVQTNRLKGKQKLEYWNNSPDTLRKVFFHLYWNAFQPGSMMDEHSRRQGKVLVRNMPDWDRRVKDRILNLKPDEIGYQKVTSLKLNGVAQKMEQQETILIVTLNRAILPGQKVVFDLDFEAQVPLQIRRSGRDNPDTKVRYSMSQWYPAICAYDKDGWHPTPYVGREFYAPFGSYDVNINIDKNYILGGTGYLKNANEIGYGYEAAGVKVPEPKTEKLTWRFTADNVHDFMWAADPEFIHKTQKIENGITLHLLYKPIGRNPAEWDSILPRAARAYPYIAKHFGPYLYKQYSFITGGDGGMEYPLATLLASPGAWLHEWMHNWYQGVIGINEAWYPWMDEGFASYAENRIDIWLKGGDVDTAQLAEYKRYTSLVKSRLEEPLTTHGDRYNTNYAYTIASYTKGAIFLEQLGYIVGASVRDQILIDFFNKWKFKHPDVNDFINVAEKRSGLQLDWYKKEWVETIHTIDYGIDRVWKENGKTKIRLTKFGQMPMPIDLLVTTKDGKKQLYYIPMNLMYGAKPVEDLSMPRTVFPVWNWTNDTYTIESNIDADDIKEVEIDPSGRLADVDISNNKRIY